MRHLKKKEEDDGGGGGILYNILLKIIGIMNKFYFIGRDIGTNPDLNRYYFSTVEELINQVPVLKSQENSNVHLRWSVSEDGNNKYTLMSDMKGIEENGTDIPLKCNSWWVCGFIYTNETDKNIYDLFPKFEFNDTNRFIERRYMSAEDYEFLSEEDKEKCIRDGGIILDRKSNEKVENFWKSISKKLIAASEVIYQKRKESENNQIETYKQKGLL